MKPKRKPMFTTLIFCLMANQAVETQIPALETTTVQISFSSKDEPEPQKNKFTLINKTKEQKEEPEYLTNDADKKQLEKDPPFIEVEDPIPELRTKPII